TRPEVYAGERVPEVLLSGHHAGIARWRRQQALARTAARRPELLVEAQLTIEDRKWLAAMAAPMADNTAASPADRTASAGDKKAGMMSAQAPTSLPRKNERKEQA
ncbi:MAG: hypothetical protein ABI294_07295, partial [Casimicrobiaceae bacterium]